ncbi:MAG TPA: metallophosphoesterase [Rhabdochlamydiaceae bacterium]|nr:metallophosphoesterase [Rhabdochlamydiaceae bacterium]
MQIWALADLHLAHSVPSKNMAVFGPVWEGYMAKMAASWKEMIKSEDLVLLPGDITWAMKLEEAKIDLEWIDALPGTKVMIRGNHDYWWSSAKKMSAIFPPSVHFIHNTAFHWKDVAIGGTRLWDTPEYNFNGYVHFQENPKARPAEERSDQDAPIFERELERLKLSLKQMNPSAKLKIAMTHYPPISADLQLSRASTILEEFGVQICVFGHLHNLKKDKPMFGQVRGVKYLLTAADYLDFRPLRVI